MVRSIFWDQRLKIFDFLIKFLIFFSLFLITKFDTNQNTENNRNNQTQNTKNSFYSIFNIILHFAKLSQFIVQLFSKLYYLTIKFHTEIILNNYVPLDQIFKIKVRFSCANINFKSLLYHRTLSALNQIILVLKEDSNFINIIVESIVLRCKFFKVRCILIIDNII